MDLSLSTCFVLFSICMHACNDFVKDGAGSEHDQVSLWLQLPLGNLQNCNIVYMDIRIVHTDSEIVGS
jgi:hypothetical protein